VRFPLILDNFSDHSLLDQLVQSDQTSRKALLPLSAGTEILIETPWFTSPTRSEPGDIAEMVRKLSQQDVVYFNGLAKSLGAMSGSTNNYGDIDYWTIFRFYSLRCGTVQSQSEQGARDVALSGLFHQGSLFQRSCQPNVHAQWIWSTEPGKSIMIFRAIRDIRPGETLSVSTDVRGMLYGRDVRHQRLFDSSGRRCSCPDPRPDQATSDRRREDIRRIMELVSDVNIPLSYPDLIPNVSTKKKEFKEYTEICTRLKLHCNVWIKKIFSITGIPWATLCSRFARQTAQKTMKFF
jgi:hypothetical protein